jgi:uncharacterized membrane protein
MKNGMIPAIAGGVKLMIGPIQLVVIGFDEDKYARDIILEIKNLRQKKAIRLFDLLYVFKHADGTIDSQEVSDLQAEEQREFGTLIKSLIGLSAKDLEHTNADEVAKAVGTAESEFGMTDTEIQGLAGDLPNGSSAIFVAYEHTWASNIREAMQRSGGYVRAQGMIDPNTLKVAANELATVLEAIDKTEAASMEKMARILSEAETQEKAARLQAAEVVMEAEALKEDAESTMAQAESMAEEAAQVEAESLARAEAALQHAEEVASEAEAMEDEAFIEAEAVRKVARRQQEEAMARAADVVHESEEIEAAAVLRAINALVNAEVIEREATREALNAILAAEVIEASAARRAAKALST